MLGIEIVPVQQHPDAGEDAALLIVVRDAHNRQLLRLLVSSVQDQVIAMLSAGDDVVDPRLSTGAEPSALLWVTPDPEKELPTGPRDQLDNVVRHLWPVESPDGDDR